MVPVTTCSVLTSRCAYVVLMICSCHVLCTSPARSYSQCHADHHVLPLSAVVLLLLVVVTVLVGAITLLITISTMTVTSSSVTKQQHLVPRRFLTQHIQYQLPTLCSLVGIGSGQRQLIAVTCIAEHA